MLILISPAKTLDYSSELPAVTATQPTQVQDAQVLIEQLRQYSLQDIARLMHLSDKLASLNTARYESWQPQHTPDNARPAVFAFKGDVYQGLDVTSLKAEHWPYLQRHLRILSGLYGVLRPLDYLQPYRLEMGTKIKTAAGNTLYDFWGERITQRLNADLAQEAQPVTLNLASTEYFSAVKPKLLQGRLITPVFKDWKNGQYKIISFYAKKARGLMVRYCTQQHIDNPEAILDFNLEGYNYSATHSKPDQPVFLRDHEAD